MSDDAVILIQVDNENRVEQMGCGHRPTFYSAVIPSFTCIDKYWKTAFGFPLFLSV